MLSLSLSSSGGSSFLTNRSSAIGIFVSSTNGVRLKPPVPGGSSPSGVSGASGTSVLACAASVGSGSWYAFH